jgi:hypothetical protein
VVMMESANLEAAGPGASLDWRQTPAAKTTKTVKMEKSAAKMQ